jgi:hypothetical protein
MAVGEARNYLKSGRLGRWVLQDNINTGSFGHVVMCRDETDPSIKVAIKVQDRSEARYHQGKDERDAALYFYAFYHRLRIAANNHE